MPTSPDLRNGDCLDVMPTLPAGSVDLTVTSPPYDNLRTYNDSLTDWNAAKWQAIIAELYRITSDGGVVVWVVGDATVDGSESGTSFRQALFAMECGFRLHDTMIYEKGGMGACGSQYAYWQNFEYMFVFSKGRPRAFNPICDRKNVRGGKTESAQAGRTKDGTTVGKERRTVTYAEFGRRNNTWIIAPTSRGSNKSGDRDSAKHPAPFPLALAADHVASWSNPGEVVFDPFLGSGTTGVAAVKSGRRFIGIERDPGYFEIARKRIAEATQRDVRASAADLVARLQARGVVARLVAA